MKFKVSFRPQAEADLFGLYEYIVEQAGLEVAGKFVDRIEAVCMSLETFPKRGKPWRYPAWLANPRFRAPRNDRFSGEGEGSCDHPHFLRRAGL